MIKEFFKASDFALLDPSILLFRSDAAAIANQTLNKAVDNWLVVYGTPKWNGMEWSETDSNEPSHKAHLAFIEELPKEPCKHQPEVMALHYGFDGRILNPASGLRKECISYYSQKFVDTYKCKYCGVKLKATWSEA